jgi:hypothetical protein
LTTILASILRIISIVCFKGLFEQGDFEENPPATVSLGCNEEDHFLTEMSNGTVVCMADYLKEEDKEFKIIDITGTFMTESSGPASGISLSDTVYDGIITKLVTSKIFGSSVSGNFAAIVCFTICFGVALSKVYDRKKKRGNDTNNVMDLFKELDAVFLI